MILLLCTIPLDCTSDNNNKKWITKVPLIAITEAICDKKLLATTTSVVFLFSELTHPDLKTLSKRVTENIDAYKFDDFFPKNIFDK